MKRWIALVFVLCLIPFSALAEAAVPADAPTVYMTKEITPEALMDIYKALGREAGLLSQIELVPTLADPKDVFGLLHQAEGAQQRTLKKAA